MILPAAIKRLWLEDDCQRLSQFHLQYIATLDLCQRIERSRMISWWLCIKRNEHQLSRSEAWRHDIAVCWSPWFKSFKIWTQSSNLFEFKISIKKWLGKIQRHILYLYYIFCILPCVEIVYVNGKCFQLQNMNEIIRQ